MKNNSRPSFAGLPGTKRSSGRRTAPAGSGAEIPKKIRSSSVPAYITRKRSRIRACVTAGYSLRKNRNNFLVLPRRERGEVLSPSNDSPLSEDIADRIEPDHYCKDIPHDRKGRDIAGNREIGYTENQR